MARKMKTIRRNLASQSAFYKVGKKRKRISIKYAVKEGLMHRRRGVGERNP